MKAFEIGRQPVDAKVKSATRMEYLKHFTKPVNIKHCDELFEFQKKGPKHGCHIAKFHYANSLAYSTAVQYTMSHNYYTNLIGLL